MKARVKATGEIVEIYRFVDTEQNEWIDCYLEFLEPIATDYWTRLEHTYVGMFMKSFLDNFDGTTSMEILADDAIKLAHALVEKMKNQSV